MKHSICVRLMISLLVSIGLLISVGMVFLYFQTTRSLTQQFDDALKTKLNLLTMFPEIDRTGIDLEFTDHHLPEFERPDQGEYYQLWTYDGKTLSKSKSLAGSDLPMRYGTPKKPLLWNIRLPNGHSGRAIGVGFLPSPENGYSLSEQEERSNAMIMVLARDRTSFIHNLHHVRCNIIILGIIMLLTTAVLVKLNLYRGLFPIRQLTKKVESIDESSLSSVDFGVETLPEELQPIADELHELALRLDSAFAREKRLTADIAHEINTPLSELRAAAEVALKWPDDRDAVDGIANKTLKTVKNLQKTIQGLLALTRYQVTDLSDKRSINVSELWDKVRTEQQSLLRKHGLRIEQHTDKGLMLLTEPTLLKTIFSNLLDNAISYSPADATIKCQLMHESHAVVFRLANPCNGLRQKDLEHIFEPLWRHDKVRTDSNHSGLGLTLVKTIAERLGMKVTAQLNESNLFSIELYATVRD